MGTFSGGKLFNKNVSKCLLSLVGPVDVFFYWPEAVLGNFYWPGAIGSLLASSPETAYPPSQYFFCCLTWRPLSVSVSQM